MTTSLRPSLRGTGPLRSGDGPQPAGDGPCVEWGRVPACGRRAPAEQRRALCGVGPVQGYCTCSVWAVSSLRSFPSVMSIKALSNKGLCDS